MQRTPVDSSNIRSIGYDEVGQILEIEFKTGSVYQYYAVPSGVYSNLMNPSSHGQYFAKAIKNMYSYSKIM
jgi:hypothetical protein